MDNQSLCREYKNLKEAMMAFTEIDVDYDWVWHAFDVGEGVEDDIHDIDEWILLDSGKCEVTVEGEDYSIDADAVNGVLVVHIPRGKKHGFIAKSWISYFVFKSRE